MSKHPDLLCHSTRVFPRDTTCQLKSAPKSEHNARNLCGTILCAALQCTASQQTIDAVVSHTSTQIHTSYIHKSAERMQTHETRIPRHHTNKQTQHPSPITHPEQHVPASPASYSTCTGQPKPPSVRPSVVQRRNVHLRRTAACARSDTT
jgi:hypothetical protein